MPWIFLLIASLFEVFWAVALKYSEGFTRTLPSVLSVAGMILSVGFLGMAVKAIPLGSAYAVWTGIGAALTAIAGMILFGEPHNFLRMGCILLIILGVAGLKITSGEAVRETTQMPTGSQAQQPS